MVNVNVDSCFLFLGGEVASSMFVTGRRVPSTMFRPVDPGRRVSSLTRAGVGRSSARRIATAPASGGSVMTGDGSVPGARDTPMTVAPIVRRAIKQASVRRREVMTSASASLSRIRRLGTTGTTAPGLGLVGNGIASRGKRPVVKTDMTCANAGVNAMASLGNRFVLGGRGNGGRLATRFVNCRPIRVPMSADQAVLVTVGRSRRTLDRMIMIKCNGGGGSGITNTATGVGLGTGRGCGAPRPIVNGHGCGGCLRRGLVHPGSRSYGSIGKRMILSFFMSGRKEPRGVAIIRKLYRSTSGRTVHLIGRNPG